MDALWTLYQQVSNNPPPPGLAERADGHIRSWIEDSFSVHVEEHDKGSLPQCEACPRGGACGSAPSSDGTISSKCRIKTRLVEASEELAARHLLGLVILACPGERAGRGVGVRFCQTATTVRDAEEMTSTKDVSTPSPVERGGGGGVAAPRSLHIRAPRVRSLAPQTSVPACGSSSLPSRPERKSRMKSASHLLLARLNIEQLIAAAEWEDAAELGSAALGASINVVGGAPERLHCLSSDRTGMVGDVGAQDTLAPLLGTPTSSAATFPMA